jgi:hypothetical protein
MNFPKLKMLPVIYKRNDSEYFFKSAHFVVYFHIHFLLRHCRKFDTDIVLPGKCKSVKDESNNHLWLSQKIQFLKKKRIKDCVEV